MEQTQIGLLGSASILYYPLLESDEIRLLSLQPRTSGEQIRCSMKPARSTESPQYEALSYMWGPKASKLIMINDIFCEVRENLWNALYHLRLDAETRVLWIDALCINQNDTDERNHQVTQMGDIYRRAKGVVAWLGLADQNSTFVMRLLWDLETKFPASDAVELPRGATYSSTLAEFDFLTIPETVTGNQNLKAILDFFCREYWTRLWILQEVALAGTLILQCGHEVVNGSTMRGLFRVLEFAKHDQVRPTTLDIHGKPSDGKDYLTHLILGTVPAKLWDSVRNLDGDQTLPSLMHYCLEFGDASCEDSRDKIYGLHSLAQDCCRENVPVDYGLSCDALCNTLLNHDLSMHSKTGRLERSQRLHKLLGVDTTSKVPQKASSIRHPSTITNKVPRLFEVDVIFKAHVTYISHELKAYTPRRCQGILLPKLFVSVIQGPHEGLVESQFPQMTKRFDLVYPLKSEHCLASDSGFVPEYTPKKDRQYMIGELVSRGSRANSAEVSLKKLLINAQKHVHGTSMESCKLALGDSEPVDDHRLCLVPNETSIGDLICEGLRSDIIIILRRDEQSTEKFRIIGRGVRYFAHSMDTSTIDRIGPVSRWPTPDFMSPKITLHIDVPTLKALTLASATPDP